MQIHELVIFSQITKINTHEETYLIHWLLLYRILINGRLQVMRSECFWLFPVKER